MHVCVCVCVWRDFSFIQGQEKTGSWLVPSAVFSHQSCDDLPAATLIHGENQLTGPQIRGDNLNESGGPGAKNKTQKKKAPGRWKRLELLNVSEPVSSQEPEISTSYTVLASQFSLVLPLFERRRKYWIWFPSVLSRVRWIFDGVFVHFRMKNSTAREKGQDFLKIRTPTHHAPWQLSYEKRGLPDWPSLASVG